MPAKTDRTKLDTTRLDKLIALSDEITNSPSNHANDLDLELKRAATECKAGYFTPADTAERALDIANQLTHKSEVSLAREIRSVASKIKASSQKDIKFPRRGGAS